ncbi:MAG: HNH endonuclease signature motif containing protein [Saprospiraceae bacterium]
MANPAISLSVRHQIFKQANDCCEYCKNQRAYSTAPFSVEHILPLSKQGSSGLENLALSCPACNGHKYNKQAALDPLTRKVVPLFHPRTQIWEEHFVWDEQRTQVLGLTPIGRATVKCLKMNRVESVNLRMVLVAFDRHPPG